jgi:hypothetical protein
LGRLGQTTDALKRLGGAHLRSCKNTIHHIHRTLRRNEGDLSSDSAGTQTILASMEEVEAEVRRIWGPLLQRQQRADRLKHALAALKRLSWALPSPDQQVVCCVKRPSPDMARRLCFRYVTEVAPSRFIDVGSKVSPTPRELPV